MELPRMSAHKFLPSDAQARVGACRRYRDGTNG
jgi:hypothetical protein